MTSESGFDVEKNLNEATTSKNQEEADKGASSMSGNGTELPKSKEKEKTNMVPFRKLFAFADSLDRALMIIGSIGAIGNGLCLPLMTILFGDLVNSFGENQNTSETVDAVSRVKFCCLRFLVEFQ